MADPRTEKGSPIFARFLKPPSLSEDEKGQWKITPALGTVYLACTSAGEVGIDISADHMLCDLTSFDRMAQRFGRVNRFGNGDAKIDIVHEAESDSEKEDAPEERARRRTLELLQELPRTERKLASPPASPSAATDQTQGAPQDERRLASPLALARLRKREDLFAEVPGGLHAGTNYPARLRHPVRRVGPHHDPRQTSRPPAGRNLPAWSRGRQKG